MVADFLPSVPVASNASNQINTAIPAEWYDEKPEFQILPVGDYTVKVTARDVFQKEGDNKVKFVWTLTVVEGEFAGKDVKHFTTIGIRGADGKLTKAPDSWLYTAMMSAIGATPDLMPEFKTEEGFNPPTDALLNRMLRISIVHNQVGDNTYANVRKVRPVDPVGQVFKGSIGNGTASGMPNF